MSRAFPTMALAIGMAVVAGAQDFRDKVEGESGVTGFVRDHSATKGWEGELGGSVDPETSKDAVLPVVYRFSGVTDDGEQGSANRKEATSVTCTNLGSVSATIEVEVFQYNGSDSWLGTVDAAAGHTYTFSTQDTTIYFDDVLLGGAPGTGNIFQGFGVVRSSRPDAVICTAQILDPYNDSPLFMSGLEMFRDSDLPTRYVFSGVTDDGEQGSPDRSNATSITCTNVSEDNQSGYVSVVVYQWNGNTAYWGGATVPPLRTYTFSTQDTTIFFDDVLLGGAPGTAAIFQGYGVVTSSNGEVVCTAMSLDPLSYPPAFVSRLNLEPDFSHIFSDGFEGESTEAWSVAVP
jgi:hypothetical protein